MSAYSGVSANDSIMPPVQSDKERRGGFMNGGRGACFLDVDNDGDDDIYVVGPGRNQMFRNDGAFVFTEITDSAGVGDTGYGMACASGDLDNDGDQDIIATNYFSHFILYRNNGNSTFTNMTAGSHIDDTGPQAGVAIADFDNDGFLDFFMAKYLRYGDKVYRNLGNWTFEDKTNNSRIADLDYGFQPIAADYNGDGLQDVYVANDFGLDTLWQNGGNFVFGDFSRISGAYDTRGGMGAAWGDYNSDGDLDILVGNYEQDGLWDNKNGNFIDVANASGVDDNWTTWGVAWLDYNNDGYLDLYEANGNVEVSSPWYHPNKLFRSNGDRTFTDVSDGSGAETPEVSRGLAVSDVDGDGMMDLYVVNMNCPAMLFKNTLASTNQWLKVKLEGTVSNRDGVGATVTVNVNSAGIHEMQLLSAGSSYLSSNSKVLSFGLRNTTQADTIVVQWPSGLRQVVGNITGNQTITIVETDTESPVARARDVTAQQGQAFALNGSQSSDNVRVVNWSWLLNVSGSTVTAKGPAPVMTLYTAGIFQGRLDVRDPFGLVGTAWFNVTIQPLVNVVVDAGPDLLIGEGTTVMFNATGESSVTPNFQSDCLFAWDFVDTSGPVALAGSSPSYTFLHPGSYPVTVNVTDPQNATDSDSLTVTVFDAIAPTIRATVPSEADEDDVLVFDAILTTDNDPAFGDTGSFRWSYESYAGPVSWFDPRVFVQFSDPGLFTVTLAVRDQTGNVATQLFPLLIHDLTAPSPNAGPDLTAYPGQEIGLTAVASWDNDPTFLTAGTFAWTIYSWNETMNLSGPNPILTFASPGIYRVELDMWDPSGNHAVAIDTMYVRVVDDVRPTARAGSDLVVEVGELVLFDGSASSDNDPSLLTSGSFVWEFQDGSVRKALPGVKAEYTFERPGSYTVRLTATDQGGNAGTAIITVTVVDSTGPVLVVQPLPTTLVSGETLRFNASGSTDNVGVTSITWLIEGPNGFSSRVGSSAGEIVLFAEGTYHLTVIAKDGAGNEARRQFNVTVTRDPNASPGGNPGGNPGGGNPGGTPSGPGPEPSGTSTFSPTSSPIAAFALLAVAGAVAVVWLLGRRKSG